MRETMQRRSSAETLLAATGARRHERVRVVARRRDMRETKQRRSSADTFSLLQDQGDMRRVRVVARRRDKRETMQRRSSAETFWLLQEQGDMKELGLWHGEETSERPRNGDHQPRPSGSLQEQAT